MYLTALGTVAVMLLVLTGLAWPFAAHVRLAPTERLLVTVAASLMAVFLFAWAVFILGQTPALFWCLPVAALGGLVAARQPLRTLVSNTEVRTLAACQLLVTVWCIGWLVTVRSYSGGGWAGDWFEHWERTRFFLEHWPLETRFLGAYTLPARPPLANVVTGVFVHITDSGFAGFQLVTAVLCSLAYLPAALFARRWGGPRAAVIAAGVFMLNPLFVQNATFAWTKLPAAFLVLASLWFFVRTRDADGPPTAVLWWAAFMGAAILAHYSAAPYALIAGTMWMAARSFRAHASWRRQTLLALLTGLLVLAPWLTWSVSEYGSGTYLSNTSVTSGDVHSGSQWVKVSLNLFDTIVPHFLRPIDGALIAQPSPWGAWRDWFFQSYQLNLLLALGSVGWLVVAKEALRLGREVPSVALRFWSWFVAAAVVLGVAVHGARDQWGLTHICLQPLILLGLAFFAARWRMLSRGWRAAAALAAAVDFACGIVLHFAVQSHALERWLSPGASAWEIAKRHNTAAQMNFGAKAQHNLEFVSDLLAAPIVTGIVLLSAATLLLIAVGRRQQDVMKTRATGTDATPTTTPA